MKIEINDRPTEIPSATTLKELRRQIKPDADLMILNGFPRQEDVPLNAGDRVVFIRRGEQPDAGELEALLAARHPPGVHARLKPAVVGVAGCGGLGSAVAVALARIGVGHLILADFDLVEPSNLNRQQFFVDQIGLPKVEALHANLSRVNPYVQITRHCERLTPKNIPVHFGAVDVLVEAFDDPAQKAMLAATFLREVPGKPLVMASGMAGFGPANQIVTRQAADNLYLIGDGETAARPGEGLMAPRVGIAAHHQANAVLRLLLGESPV
ncbi:MAG: sulfur carrier protein ThiS adenylyltransferase ThiF [Desulfuromonadaceae bacterium]